MDDRVDRAIDAALDGLRTVKPAPDFLPRLRAHVEAQPRRAPIHWWIPFAASATAIAAGVIVAALVRAPRAVVPPPSPIAIAAPVLASAPTADAVPAAATPLRVQRRERPAVREPQVLVPAGQRAAIARFAEALNAGDEHALAVVRRLAEGTPSSGPGDVTVAPIEIPPVVVVPLKESM